MPCVYFSNELTQNLGPNVNSIYHELAPVISPDGKKLYFAREAHPSNTGIQSLSDDQDIWVSELDEKGNWGPAKHIEAIFNSRVYDYPIGASADGKTLYIGNVYKPDGTITSGVSFTRLIRDHWLVPEGLQIRQMYNKSSTVNYYMASDEKTLLLNLHRDDTFGILDLYVSFQTEDGRWSEPRNLGKDINSAKSEITPFLASDMKTLYFASD